MQNLSSEFVKRSKVAFLCFALLFVKSGLVHGEAWQVQPQVSLGAGYDDNWFLSSTNPEAVTAPRVAGDLALRRLTETMNLEGIVRLDYVTYSGVSDERLPDSSNQLYRFKGLFRNLNQTNRFDLDATYRRDTLNRTVRISFAPDDVGVDPDTDVDESLVRRSIDRERFFFFPGWKINLTERFSFGLKYAYRETNYDNDQAIGTGLVDFTDQLLTAEFAYRVSARSSLNISAIGERYEAPSDPSRFPSGESFDRQFDQQRVLLGWDYKFTETTTLGLDVGAIRTDFNIQRDLGEDETGVNDGFVAHVRGSQLVGVTRFDARIGRDRYPSGSGDIVQTDEVVGNVSHRFGARTIFSLQGRVFQNESLLRDNPRTNRRYLSVRPRVRWRMTQWWYLDFLYQYRRQKRDIEEESADSNSVLFSVVYSQPTTLD